MNETRIIIDISDEVRALGFALVNAILYPSEAEKQLNEVKKELLGTLSVLRTDHQGGESKIAKSVVKDPEPLTMVPDPQPEQEQEEVEEPTPPEGFTPAITPEQLRATFTATVKKNKREEAKALLTEFGVERLSDIGPTQYDEFYERLEAL